MAEIELPVLVGDGEVRSVVYEGVVVGEAHPEPASGGYLVTGQLPGQRYRVERCSATLERAWARFLAEARPHLEERARRRERIAALRARIVEQAGDDWLDLAVDPAVDPSGVLRVPRAPFVRWALKYRYNHLWPAWDEVSPLGLKMHNDDRNHSDWMVGAGLDPAEWYDFGGRDERAALLNRAAYDAMWGIQDKMLFFKCAVLSGRGSFEGSVWHADRHPGELPPPNAVLILPDLSMRWIDQVRAATGAAIVTEQGGATAHLVVDRLGEGTRIVRVPDARRLYPEPFISLKVNCDTGSVSMPGD